MKTAIINGTIFDATGAAPRRGTIVVTDRRITAVLPATAAPPVADRTIDASGCTVMPGLIDSHDHQTYHNTFGPLAQQWSLSRDQMVIRSCIAACDALRHGVTSIREMGAANGTNLAMKWAKDRGEMIGPRMVTCGEPLSIVGGHAYQISREVGGPDTVREIVRQRLKEGVDFIKIMASNEQPMRGRPEQTAPQFTREELRVAVEEAHDAGIKVAVHACGTRAIERCLDAGVDTIEHAVYLNRDLAQRMKQQKVFYTPTLGIYRANSDPHWRRGKAKEQFCKVLAEAHLASFQHAVEAGLRWAVGTDAIVPVAIEMQYMVEAGLDPLTVLCAATRTNADLIERSEDLGTLEAGKLADIILVAGNPLADMRVLLKVRTIMQDGVVFSPDQLLPMLPLAEPGVAEEIVRRPV